MGAQEDPGPDPTRLSLMEAQGRPPRSHPDLRLSWEAQEDHLIPPRLPASLLPKIVASLSAQVIVVGPGGSV